jgi:dTDP-4-amino-4,6-dideoxygalactose transaminase
LTESVKTASPVTVASPMLPPLDEVTELLREIWDSKWVTNHGPLSLRLENHLREYLGVATAKLFNNGTNALMVALARYKLPPGSEVITTPLTFAATAHSITWCGLKPVFVDVAEDDLTIDPEAVAAAVTDRTSAILPVQALRAIADRHSLKLVYDAAHAFAATFEGRSVATLGDASVFSFHATKLFNTLEGGLITSMDPSDADEIYLFRNFGIKNEDEVLRVGLNGKINEVQAAIGLLNLKIMEQEKTVRKNLRAAYTEAFADIDGVKVQKQNRAEATSEQYFLIRIDSSIAGVDRETIYAALKERGITSRRYFYPLCTDFEPYRGWPILSKRNSPYAEQAKKEVLCLPFHSGVTAAHVEIIRDTILSSRSALARPTN